MKILINFDTETMECKVRWESDEGETMPLWDAMPYVSDALYDLVKQEAKKQNLR